MYQLFLDLLSPPPQLGMILVLQEAPGKRGKEAPLLVTPRGPGNCSASRQPGAGFGVLWVVQGPIRGLALSLVRNISPQQRKDEEDL